MRINRGDNCTTGEALIHHKLARTQLPVGVKFTMPFPRSFTHHVKATIKSSTFVIAITLNFDIGRHAIGSAMAFIDA